MAEEWLSGLRRTLGKRVRVYALREFESRLLRHVQEKACGVHTLAGSNPVSSIFIKLKNLREEGESERESITRGSLV